MEQLLKALRELEFDEAVLGSMSKSDRNKIRMRIVRAKQEKCWLEIVGLRNKDTELCFVIERLTKRIARLYSYLSEAK